MTTQPKTGQLQKPQQQQLQQQHTSKNNAGKKNIKKPTIKLVTNKLPPAVQKKNNLLQLANALKMNSKQNNSNSNDDKLNKLLR